MRIAIFGIGAMGCLYGARLTPHADVTLVGHWVDQIKALGSAPLQITELDRHITRTSLNAVNTVEGLPPVDAALILTKSGGTKTAAKDAAKILKQDGIALTLQNGLGNLEVMQTFINAERTALGVTTQGATVVKPGHIRHGGNGLTYLANREEQTEKIVALADLFQRVGLETQVETALDGIIWGKLAINAAINPLTALLRVPNGALIENEWSRGVMCEAAHEVAAIAEALGITLPFDDAAKQAEIVAKNTARNYASMFQDAQRQAETEIEVICGAVMRYGKETSIPTPVNEMLYRMVKALELSYSRQVV